MAIGFHFDDIEWESYYKEQAEWVPNPYNVNVNVTRTKLGAESKLLLCREEQLGDLQNLQDETVVVVYS